MPPFQQNLNADEIYDLMQFLHSLKGNSDNAEVMHTHWKHLGSIFIQIVAAMPEDKYDFRPKKGLRSFRQLVMHTVEENYMNMGYIAGKNREESEKLVERYKNITTRAEILDALEDSYDYGDMVLADRNDQNGTDVVTTMCGERTTRAAAVLRAFDDTMDHYGNLVIYLRLNGIVPPDAAEAEEDVVPPIR
jgi:uncharacterized damage-inducible protein DinB